MWRKEDLSKVYKPGEEAESPKQNRQIFWNKAHKECSNSKMRGKLITM